jgi:hypothetical protein
MGGVMLYCDAHDAEEVANCGDFLDVVDMFPQVKFYQPSPVKAPWHWQAKWPCADGVDAVLNFWPHKGKVQRFSGGKPEVGKQAHINAIREAIEHVATIALERDDFSLIED